LRGSAARAIDVRADVRGRGDSDQVRSSARSARRWLTRGKGKKWTTAKKFIPSSTMARTSQIGSPCAKASSLHPPLVGLLGVRFRQEGVFWLGLARGDLCPRRETPSPSRVCHRESWSERAWASNASVRSSFQSARVCLRQMCFSFDRLPIPRTAATASSEEDLKEDRKRERNRKSERASGLTHGFFFVPSLHNNAVLSLQTRSISRSTDSTERGPLQGMQQRAYLHLHSCLQLMSLSMLFNHSNVLIFFPHSHHFPELR